MTGQKSSEPVDPGSGHRRAGDPRRHLSRGGPRGGSGERGAAELEIWSDPGFRREFLGSYGVRAEVEPRVTAVEYEALEKKVLPLMGRLEPARRR